MSLKNRQTRIVTLAPAAAAGPAGLVIGTLDIIDVDPPTAPSIASKLAIDVNTRAGGAERLSVDNTHHAFMIGGQTEPINVNKLQIANVSDRSAPFLEGPGIVASNCAVYAMIRHGNFLIVVRNNDAALCSNPNIMQVYDISNLAAPVSVATFNIDSAFAVSQDNPTSALAIGDTMIITSNGGFTVPFGGRLGFYDISALPAITQTTVTILGGAGRGAELPDCTATHAYINRGNPLELEIYDITVPAAPVLTGNLLLPANMIILSDIDNGKMYGIGILPAQKNLCVFDVSNPAAPALVSTTPVTTTRNFSVRGGQGNDHAYLLTTPAGFQKAMIIFDTSNPAAPAQQGTVIYETVGSNSMLVMDLP